MTKKRTESTLRQRYDELLSISRKAIHKLCTEKKTKYVLERIDSVVNLLPLAKYYKFESRKDNMIPAFTLGGI